MPKGRTRIGPGEFQTPGPSQLARFAYLLEINRLKPAVLDELASIADGEPQSRWGWIGRIQTADTAAIAAWGTSHGLADAWIHEVAAMTIHEWRASPGSLRQWTLLSSGGPEPEWPTLVWNPLMVTRTNFLERQLPAYLDRVERLAAQTGYVHTANMRRLNASKALTELVRYQVCGETKARIVGGGINKDSKARALDKTLKRTADLIGITLRKTRT